MWFGRTLIGLLDFLPLSWSSKAIVILLIEQYYLSKWQWKQFHLVKAVWTVRSWRSMDCNFTSLNQSFKVCLFVFGESVGATFSEDSLERSTKFVKGFFESCVPIKFAQPENLSLKSGYCGFFFLLLYFVGVSKWPHNVEKEIVDARSLQLGV